MTVEILKKKIPVKKCQVLSKPSCGTVALYGPFFFGRQKKKRTIKGYGSAANLNQSY